jgi:guanylate kinase
MDADDSHKIIIITAPSGSGKSTIVNFLLKHFSNLKFSVSACTRMPRLGEVNGVNYHFISAQDFETKIKEDAFAEYEMVYPGKYYGTLKSELTSIWNEEKYPLVDIDVQGAMRLKKYYQENSLTIFIKAPSIEELENRLRNRGTETEESLKERISKATEELSFSNHFDHIIVNDNLSLACAQTQQLIALFIQK